MSLTLPPREHPVLDDNGLIDDRWFAFLTRGSVGQLPADAKAWAYITVSGGVPTLQSGYNITSITDDGVGLLTITLETDFRTSNWPAIGLVTISAVQIHIYQQTQTAGSVQLTCVRDSDNAASDPAAWSFVGFGNQA